MDVPLTPIVVDVVTFDRAPLGRRGYHEDQVDDFLDRVQATLAGKDNLTAEDVRRAEFDAAPFIRRGYHEDQVDEFLDLVVEELTRRAGEVPAAAIGLPTTDGPVPNPPGAPAFNSTPATPPNGTPPRGQAAGVPLAGNPASPSGAPGSAGATTPANPSGAAAPPAASATGHPAAAHHVDSASPTPPPSRTPAPSRPNTPPSGAPAPSQTTGTPGYQRTGGIPVVADPSTPVAWVPFPTTPRQVPPPTSAEQTNPMLFVLPPSLPSPSTQPLTRAASGPPNPGVATTTDNTGASDEVKPGDTGAATTSEPSAAGETEPSETHEATPSEAHASNTNEATPRGTGAASVAAGQAASAFRAGATSGLGEQPRTLADYAPKRPPAPEPVVDGYPAFPFPPAPPGEPGYAPADVARLARLLANSPDREQLAGLTFAVTTTGGYHTGTIDALRQAWLDALATKRP